MSWIAGLFAATNPYRWLICAGLAIAAVLAVLWWRASLIAEGVEKGRNQVIANELRACEANETALRLGIEKQNAELKAWKAEADGMAHAASAAQAQAAEARRQAKRIKVTPASNCAAAVDQLWREAVR